MIKSIPLCVTFVVDTLTWLFNASGTYTVKSGYNFLAREELHNRFPSHSDNNSELWKLIWGLNVPNKIKNFVWRSGKDAILAKKNLKRRKILNEDTCDQCGQAEESVLHAIWECSRLSPIWDAKPDFSFRQVRSFADIKELLLYVSNACDKVELLVVIMWNIWFRRNQLRVSQLLPTSQQSLTDYQQASSIQRAQRVTPPSTRVAWHPPPDGYVKINFNGATFKDINKAGLGVVIRDSFGQVLASLSEQITLPFSSDLVEAMAAPRAISFAAKLGFLRFILEGDSELIIKALQSKEDSLAPFGHILAAANPTTEVNCIYFSTFVNLAMLLLISLQNMHDMSQV